MTKGLLFGLLLCLASPAGAQKRREASLAEQKMCSDQARHFEGAHTNVSNHYDKSRNICFVQVAKMVYDEKDPDRYIGLWLDLQDAFENTMYALCTAGSDNKVPTCWAVDPTNNAEKKFKTTEAWTRFVTENYLTH